MHLDKPTVLWVQASCPADALALLERSFHSPPQGKEPTQELAWKQRAAALLACCCLLLLSPLLEVEELRGQLASRFALPSTLSGLAVQMTRIANQPPPSERCFRQEACSSGSFSVRPLRFCSEILDVIDSIRLQQYSKCVLIQ